MEIIKIGGVELYESEVRQLYEEHKYIVTYGGVWQIFYSAAQKMFYGQKVIAEKGITRKGRFYTMDAKTINHLVGSKVLNED